MTRPRPRPTTGTTASPSRRTRRTRRWATSGGSAGTLGPTVARWMREHRRELHDAIMAGADPRSVMAQGYHHAILPLASARDRRTEIRWAIRDVELRTGSPTDRPLAAGDRGRPADAAHPGRGGHPLDAPGALAGGRWRRHAGRSPGRAGGRAAPRGRLLRCRAVGHGQLRCRRDLGCRPLRGRSRGRPARRGRHGGHRHRWRAVRPSPAVPGPVPAAPADDGRGRRTASGS